MFRNVCSLLKVVHKKSVFWKADLFSVFSATRLLWELDSLLSLFSI